MKNNEKLKKYIDKIKIESIIKSIIYGFIIGLVFVVFISFVLYLFKTKELLLTIVIGLIVTIISSVIIYKKVFIPSINKVANRIDELGLHERMITMVENEDKDSFIYQKQREDAFEKLETVKTSEIKYKFSMITFIILGITLVLSGFSLTLPDRGSSNINSTSSSFNSNSSSVVSTSTSSSSSELLDEEAIIQEMLDKLREIIEKAGIDQDVKDELHAIVDALEEELKGLETLEEKIQAIKDAQKDIEKRIQEELLKMSLGRALQQYDLTKELGIAIYQEDLDKVNIAMNNLIILIQQSENPLEDAKKIMECLNNALNIATKEKNEALIEAVRNFVNNLASLVGETMSIHIQTNEEEINSLADGEDASSIIEVLEIANQEIQDALRKNEETQVPEQGEGEEDKEGEQTEQDVQDAGNEMDSTIDDAIEDLEDLLEKEQEEDQEQEGNQGNEGEPDDEVPPPSFDDSDLEGDPVIDGETPYLDVFDEYYEQILEYLANNDDIPDDIREAIEEYLEMIKG